MQGKPNPSTSSSTPLQSSSVFSLEQVSALGKV
jgi:hypothetical protein